jgi:pimeloyl-ACP methyl ester carboxylesterase
MLTRRDTLKLGFTSCLSASLIGCSNQLPGCPVSWVPSLLAPVFYGYKDYNACANLADCEVNHPIALSDVTLPANPNTAMRVYYPTLDGSPQNAAILSGCRRFPLVIFVHGMCGGTPYEQWIELPGELARSGYVVAVTNYGGVIATGDPTVTAPLHTVHQWFREHWEYKDHLMPSPNTAVVGHSYGATLAAQLANEIPAMAFASLSGVFADPNVNANILLSPLAVPSLFFWGSATDFDAILFRPDQPLGGPLWSLLLKKTAHAIVFSQGAHGTTWSPAPPAPAISQVRVSWSRRSPLTLLPRSCPSTCHLSSPGSRRAFRTA